MVESRPDWCIRGQRAWGLADSRSFTTAKRSAAHAQSVRRWEAHTQQMDVMPGSSKSRRQCLGGFCLSAGVEPGDLRKERGHSLMCGLKRQQLACGASGRSYSAFPADCIWKVRISTRLVPASLLPSLGATGNRRSTGADHGLCSPRHEGFKERQEYVTATKEIQTMARSARLWCCSRLSGISRQSRSAQGFWDKYRSPQYAAVSAFQFCNDFIRISIRSRSPREDWYG